MVNFHTGMKCHTYIANQQILSTQTVADSFIKEKSIIQYTYIYTIKFEDLQSQVLLKPQSLLHIMETATFACYYYIIVTCFYTVTSTTFPIKANRIQS